MQYIRLYICPFVIRPSIHSSAHPSIDRSINQSINQVKVSCQYTVVTVLVPVHVARPRIFLAVTNTITPHFLRMIIDVWMITILLVHEG
jgi:preprotein translocase subunit SecF